MERVLLISVSPGETRIAQVNEGLLTSVAIIRPETRSLVGEIYLGRIESLHQGLQAAFVDIGTGKSGFLSVDDLRPRGERKGGSSVNQYINEGDSVVVHVLRDPVEDKGVKLSGLCPRGINQLSVEQSREIWEAACLKSKEIKAPSRLTDGVHPAQKAFGEYLSHKGHNAGDRVITDDAEMFSRLQNEIGSSNPERELILSIYTDTIPLFEVYGVEEQLEGALGSEVKLPSGGTIHIEPTRALIAIDVDSGGAEKGKREESNTLVNKEAATAATHHISLRNLSGQIVIDFLPMKEKSNRDYILKTFRKGLAGDHLKFQVNGFTRLGLLEMTRQRQGQSLTEIMCVNNHKLEKTATTYALEALRRIHVEACAEPVTRLTIVAHKKIIKALRGKTAAALAEAEARLGITMTLEVDHDLDYGEYELVRR